MVFPEDPEDDLEDILYETVEDSINLENKINMIKNKTYIISYGIGILLGLFFLYIIFIFV